MKDLNNGIRETQGTILAKNEAIKVYDKVFTPGARSLEAAFRLAGMTDLADRVKPSTRRPGRLADEVASESEGQEGQGQAGEEQESEGQKGGAPSVESLGIEEDGTTDA